MGVRQLGGGLEEPPGPAANGSENQKEHGRLAITTVW